MIDEKILGCLKNFELCSQQFKGTRSEHVELQNSIQILTDKLNSDYKEIERLNNLLTSASTPIDLPNP